MDMLKRTGPQAYTKNYEITKEYWAKINAGSSPAKSMPVGYYTNWSFQKTCMQVTYILGRLYLCIHEYIYPSTYLSI